MGSTKKGASWYSGLKAHVGSDPQGRVHSSVVTSASVHDSEIMEDCLHGVCERRASTAGRIRWGGVARPTQGEPRQATELCGLLLQHQEQPGPCSGRACLRGHQAPLGLSQGGLSGLAKNAAQVFTLFALANFYLARQELDPT